MNKRLGVTTYARCSEMWACDSGRKGEQRRHDDVARQTLRRGAAYFADEDIFETLDDLEKKSTSIISRTVTIQHVPVIVGHSLHACNSSCIHWKSPAPSIGYVVSAVRSVCASAISGNS